MMRRGLRLPLLPRDRRRRVLPLLRWRIGPSALLARLFQPVNVAEQIALGFFQTTTSCCWPVHHFHN